MPVPPKGETWMNVDAAITTAPPVNAKENIPSTDDLLGKDTFLQLLVTQLRHQNPMNPTGNAEFLSQSAQFSALEQMRTLNTSVESLIELNKSSSRTAALNLIGKHVEADYSDFSLSAGSPVNLSYSLSEDASTTITINNDGGTPVRTINGGELSAGDHNCVWDGMSDTGIQLPDGQYNYEVSAINSDGAAVEALETISGIVDGLILDSEPYLSIGGARVPLWSVKQVLEGADDV